MGIGLVIGAVLNRLGATRTAAYFVPGLLTALIMLTLIGAPGLQLIGLPIYDLFVIPIFITSLNADQRAPWIFAIVAIAFIVADFTLQPHALITATTAHGSAQSFDDIAYEVNKYGYWGTINRHVALCFFAALFGWLGARSVDTAIARADRAEELAALEGAIADQKRQLDVGVEQLLMAHTRAANGDYSVRVNLGQSNSLWVVGQSLNNMLTRLQKAGQAEHQLRRTEEELRRLAAAIDDARAGRPPLWPAPSGTVADEIVLRINPAARQLNPQGFSDPGQPTQLGRPGQQGQPGQQGYYQGQYPGQPMQGMQGMQGAPNSGPGGQRSPYGYGQQSDPYQSHYSNQSGQQGQPRSPLYQRPPSAPRTSDLGADPHMPGRQGMPGMRGGYPQNPQGYYDNDQEAPMDGFAAEPDQWAYQDEQERR